MFCNEQEAVTIVKDAVTSVDKVANIVVAKRVPIKGNPLSYEAYVACQTSAGNDTLVAKLMSLTLSYDDMEFAGSDVDVMQGGASINDFIMVKAIIRPKFN